jgi:glycosyltransferase involved in cell wall biosynthesis
VSNSLKVRFVGKFGENNTNLVQQLDLANVVELTGSVSHNKCIEYQIEADLLLIIIYSCNQNVPDLFGKLFEYIGAKNPILVLVLDCEAKDLIVKEKLGKTVVPKDIDGIKNAIFEYYNN